MWSTKLRLETEKPLYNCIVEPITCGTETWVEQTKPTNCQYQFFLKINITNTRHESRTNRITTNLVRTRHADGITSGDKISSTKEKKKGKTSTEMEERNSMKRPERKWLNKKLWRMRCESILKNYKLRPYIPQIIHHLRKFLQILFKDKKGKKICGRTNAPLLITPC